MGSSAGHGVSAQRLNVRSAPGSDRRQRWAGVTAGFSPGQVTSTALSTGLRTGVKGRLSSDSDTPGSESANGPGALGGGAGNGRPIAARYAAASHAPAVPQIIVTT